MGATGEVTVEAANGQVGIEAEMGGLNAPDWLHGGGEVDISK